MEDHAEFLEIPVLDDANGSGTRGRGADMLGQLAAIGVDTRGRRVVDLGAGFGSLSMASARAGARRVVAVDVHPGRLEAIDQRARLSGLRISTLQMNLLDDWTGTADADVAFLVGVVEYAGLWNLDAPPAQLQEKVIRTAFAALRPGGVLVLATKNRAWPAFAYRDAHTQQPLVNCLPRGLADRVSMLRSEGPYRLHIHSPTGWAALVRSAGFSDVSLYVPYFSYQMPILVVDRPRFRDVVTIRRWPKQGEERAVATGRAWLVKAVLMALASLFRIPLSHSIVIVATK